MRWTIGRRITAGFALGLLLVIAVAAIGSWALNTTSHGYRSAIQIDREVQDVAFVAWNDLRGANIRYLEFLLDGRDESALARDSLSASGRTRLAQLAREAADPVIRSSWQEASDLAGQWDALSRRSVDAGRAGQMEEAARIRREEVVPVRLSLDAALVRGLELTTAHAQALGEEATATGAASQTALWIGALVALLLGLAAALLLNRAITRPLRETSTVVATSATEILAATTQQASGATQSLSAVTETAATADEVVQTAEQAAERARAVAGLAQRAAEIGRQGREAVESSIAAMDRIKSRVESISDSILALAEQAQAIGEIISTVNDLAEQTNLLALNASIEAARAGEAGRGFAVVAAEIRGLADESKSATARVRQILGEIQRATSGAVMAMEEGTKQAEAGSHQVVEAGETIRALVDAVNQAAQAAAQISASAGQQSTGMGQIREAIANIQEAAEQNLAATRQAESAAQDLNRLGSELLELVGHDDRGAVGVR